MERVLAPSGLGFYGIANSGGRLGFAFASQFQGICTTHLDDLGYERQWFLCRMRIFTNEEATVNALVRADARLDPVAWNDPLAFGRLPLAADLSVYVAERARILEAVYWDDFESVEGDFKLRNESLERAFESGVDVHLIFGGSLRDQLQLAQILCWVSYRSEKVADCIRLMVVDGPLSIFDDGALLEVTREGERLDSATLEAYQSAWLAVTSPDPSHVARLYHRLRDDGQQLALVAALERWLQELPSVDNGLSVSECQILDAVRLGVRAPRALFDAVQETEAAIFRNNWEFWQLIDMLASGDDPALRASGGNAFICPPRDLEWIDFHEQELELTESGSRLLGGSLHNSQRASPERWLGGACIKSSSEWFWDYGAREIRHSLEALST